MTLQNLLDYCKEKVKQYPILAEEIKDFYSLAEMEVEDGESEYHECEMAVYSINELIKESNHD